MSVSLSPDAVYTVAPSLGTTYQAALAAYAADGFALTPLGIRTKVPILYKWQLSATADPDQLGTWFQEYPNSNFGIATGSKSGFVVIDLDSPEAEQRWAELQQSLGFSEPDTYCQTTARGRHIFLLAPGIGIGNLIGALGNVIDVKGDGGQVPAPGSIHPSGAIYTPNRPLTRAGLAEMPKELLAHLISLRSSKGDRLAKVDKVQSGFRNDRAYKEACKLRGIGGSYDAIIAAMRSRNGIDFVPPLADEELIRVVESACTHDANDPLRSIIFDEMSLATAFAERHAATLRYIPNAKTFMWNDVSNHWQEDRKNTAQALMFGFIEDLLSFGKRWLANIPEDQRREPHKTKANEWVDTKEVLEPVMDLVGLGDGNRIPQTVSLRCL